MRPSELSVRYSLPVNARASSVVESTVLTRPKCYAVYFHRAVITKRRDFFFTVENLPRIPSLEYKQSIKEQRLLTLWFYPLKPSTRALIPKAVLGSNRMQSPSRPSPQVLSAGERPSLLAFLSSLVTCMALHGFFLSVFSLTRP